MKYDTKYNMKYDMKYDTNRFTTWLHHKSKSKRVPNTAQVAIEKRDVGKLAKALRVV